MKTRRRPHRSRWLHRAVFTPATDRPVHGQRSSCNRNSAPTAVRHPRRYASGTTIAGRSCRDGGTSLASAGVGHAPDTGRNWYYYRVSFADFHGHQGAHIGTGQFGVPVLESDAFPGWATALRTYNDMRAEYLAMSEVPRQWALL